MINNSSFMLSLTLSVLISAVGVGVTFEYFYAQTPDDQASNVDVAAPDLSKANVVISNQSDKDRS